MPRSAAAGEMPPNFWAEGANGGRKNADGMDFPDCPNEKRAVAVTGNPPAGG